MKAGRRQTKTLEKWARRVRDWKSSRKKAIEWCRKKDISYTYFISLSPNSTETAWQLCEKNRISRSSAGEWAL